MAAQHPYEVKITRHGAGDNGVASAPRDDVLAGPSALYTGGPAFPSSYSTQTPTSSDQGATARNGAGVGPTADPSKEGYVAEAKEDGTVPAKSRGLSRKNLFIGLCILLVVLGAALGGALGATLGKHSSSDAAAKTSTATETSSSVQPSSTTSSIPGSSTTSTTSTATAAASSFTSFTPAIPSTTTTTRMASSIFVGSTTTTTTSHATSTSTASTTSATSSSSPPPVVTGVAYLIINYGRALDAVITMEDFNGSQGKISGRRVSDSEQNQTWVIEAADNGSWYIRSAQTVSTYISFNAPAQQSDPLIALNANPLGAAWVIESISSDLGTVRIRSPDDSLNLAFDLADDGEDSHDSPIVLWGSNSNSSQSWVFKAR